MWSRFGIRALALSLLLVGVGGGYYLGQARTLHQHRTTAADADQKEIAYLKERHRDYMAATARQREAQQLAADKAAAAAQAESERAAGAEDATSRRKREEQESKPYAGPIPASCEEYRGNREIGCALLLNSGFPLGQMPCLDKLWTKESGWNHKARNPSSGAYGIPQAYPGGKMRSAGADWETNPATQITWGLRYIKGRYGTPCDAWAHSRATGSY